MQNYIVIGILIIMVGLAVRYIYKEKKRGSGCSGCPSAGGCYHRGCGDVKKS